MQIEAAAGIKAYAEATPTFEYNELTLSADKISSEDKLKIYCSVKNTGAMAHHMPPLDNDCLATYRQRPRPFQRRENW